MNVKEHRRMTGALDIRFCISTFSFPAMSSASQKLPTRDRYDIHISQRNRSKIACKMVPIGRLRLQTHKMLAVHCECKRSGSS